MYDDDGYAGFRVIRTVVLINLLLSFGISAIYALSLSEHYLSDSVPFLGITPDQRYPTICGMVMVAIFDVGVLGFICMRKAFLLDQKVL